MHFYIMLYTYIYIYTHDTRTHKKINRVKGGPTSPGFSATSWAVPQNQMLGDGAASLHDGNHVWILEMECTWVNYNELTTSEPWKS